MRFEPTTCTSSIQEDRSTTTNHCGRMLEGGNHFHTLKKGCSGGIRTYVHVLPPAFKKITLPLLIIVVECWRDDKRMLRWDSNLRTQTSSFQEDRSTTINHCGIVVERWRKVTTVSI